MVESTIGLDDSGNLNGGLTGKEEDPPESSSRRERRDRRRRPPKELKQITTLIFHPVFVVLFGLLVLATCISFFLVLNHPDDNLAAQMAVRKNSHPQQHKVTNNDLKVLQEKLVKKKDSLQKNPFVEEKLHGHQPKLVPKYDPKKFDASNNAPHLQPFAPPLPAFHVVEGSDELIDDLLHHNKPTMAGMIAFFQKYLDKLHALHKANSKTNKLPEMDIIDGYFQLTEQELTPLESAYRGRTIFPIREEEDSIFISLAAFREHLLAKTLESAFDRAENPDKLYIGAVIQNCFGMDGVQCRTGLQVVGKNEQGKDMTKVSDAPPDENGIETFCKNPKYTKYCENGHVRTLYVHDTDALGPATARYYASKLWGGETYFMQMDSHLQFARHWDTLYKEEVHLAKNCPKAVLSAYPPGFSDFSDNFEGGTPGGRLCTCEFSRNGVENHIIRINQAGRTPKDAERPAQIAFIAAGFFFAHATFLQDVPFDPYVPWCFMGEEIALSARAWTHGWDIYAPRKSLIAHQYRPGRLGLPKFWESVGRDSGRPQLNTKLQKHVIRRIKHMIGYTEDTPEAIQGDGDGIVLTDYEHYSLGNARALQEYLKLTNIDVVNQQCKRMQWCEQGTLF